MRSNTYCFFLWSPRMLRRRAYHFFGVRSKSYASRIVDNLYDFYIAGANNLRLQYFRYYKKEFRSYREFLTKRYALYPAEVEKLNSWRGFVKELMYEPNLYLEELIRDEKIEALMKNYLGESENED